MGGYAAGVVLFDLLEEEFAVLEQMYHSATAPQSAEWHEVRFMGEFVNEVRTLNEQILVRIDRELGDRQTK